MLQQHVKRINDVSNWDIALDWFILVVVFVVYPLSTTMFRKYFPFPYTENTSGLSRLMIPDMIALEYQIFAHFIIVHPIIIPVILFIISYFIIFSSLHYYAFLMFVFPMTLTYMGLNIQNHNNKYINRSLWTSHLMNRREIVRVAHPAMNYCVMDLFLTICYTLFMGLFICILRSHVVFVPS